MKQCETFGFAIARPVGEVYEFLLEPTNFPKWAFVGDVQMRHLGGRRWAVETSVGPRIIDFAERNDFGLLDHGILRSEGEAPHLTGMWVIENGAGTELVYTNFRREGMTDEEWSSVKTWIVTDLLALQSLLETRGKVEPVMPAKMICIGIDRPARDVYDFLCEPLNFGKWVFAGDAGMEPLGDGEWAVETSVGARIIRFSIRNHLGVASYGARLHQGAPLHPIPMRVMPNDGGTELIYGFLQRPGTTDEEWASVIEWVTADITALKAMLEVG
jgi:hypothetical protein